MRRTIQISIIAILVIIATAIWLLFFNGRLFHRGSADKEQIYYYVLIPNVTPNAPTCIFSAVCMRIDDSIAAGLFAKTPPITAWYSATIFTPGHPSVEHPDGGRFCDYVRESKIVDDGTNELPASIAEIITLLHKLRDYTSRDLIFQPMFPSLDEPSFCENVPHLNVYISEATLSREERCKWIIHSMYGGTHQPPYGADKSGNHPSEVADALREQIGSFAKMQDIRYWPEYNILIVKADASFGKKVSQCFDRF